MISDTDPHSRTVTLRMHQYLAASQGDSTRALRLAVHDAVAFQRMDPPPGWFVFGTHAGLGTELEFHGRDAVGMPVWERPKLTEDAKESAEILYPSDHEVDDPFGETGVARSDPYGYNEYAQQAFLRGVEWRNERG